MLEIINQNLKPDIQGLDTISAGQNIY